MAINETIARLDRDAERLHVDLRRTGDNSREFDIYPGRTIQYQPGGKGVVRVRAYLHQVLECEDVVSIERMRQLLYSARRAVTLRT